MNSKTVPLEPCPFCGVVPSPEYDGDFEHPENGCVIEGLQFWEHESEAWNTRTAAPPAPDLSELRGLVQRMREDARGLVAGAKALPTDFPVTRLNEWADELEAALARINK